jgi:predicted metallopeptidase
MEWYPAPEIKRQIKKITQKLSMDYIDPQRIICFKSVGSTSRARARIWSLPRVWQLALNIPAHYIIEVISSRFNRLSDQDKVRVLIHELLHIPKNFSGSLLSHRGRYHRIGGREVEDLYQRL